MKRCGACEKHKPLAAFYRDRSKRDGRATACKSCVRARVDVWRFVNDDRVAAYDKYRSRAHSERIVARVKRWAQKNPDRVRLNSRVSAMRYYARKTRAQPAWANEFFIKEIYALADLRTRITGFAWEVDHIVPLRSKVVCGLHCEANLRVVPAAVNRRKHNSFSLEG